MTEFEMAYLLTDMQIAMFASVTLTMTIVSGFLVASYVAAHKLNGTMTWLFLGVYSFWWVQSVFMGNRQFTSYANLVGKMHAFAVEGKGLAWHATASSIATTDVLEAAPIVGVVFNLVVFAASIAFFFQCRRAGQKADAAATVTASDVSPSPQRGGVS